MFITTRISLRGVRGGNVAGKVVRHGNVARSIAGRTADPSDYTRRNLNFTYIQNKLHEPTRVFCLSVPWLSYYQIPLKTYIFRYVTV